MKTLATWLDSILPSASDFTRNFNGGNWLIPHRQTLTKVRTMRRAKNILLINFLVLPAMALSGCATLEEAVGEAIAETHRATLISDEVVPAGGDRDGFAKAEVSVGDEVNQVCYDINQVRNLGTITAVTIHRGARGSTGPVVLRLKEANESGWKNCVGKSEWIEDRLEWRPDNYYVQIATSDYPNGAIRGQLRP